MNYVDFIMEEVNYWESITKIDEDVESVVQYDFTGEKLMLNEVTDYDS